MRSSLLIAAFSLSIHAMGAPISQSKLLTSIEVEHPPCLPITQLAVSWDSFGPVANDLEGVQDYNHIVRLAKESDWRGVEKEAKRFRAAHEASPLMEAVAFLVVRAKVDQISLTDAPAIREAEKLLKEAILLYPKSELVAPVSAAVANYWLQAGKFQKSLAIYQSLRHEQPFHALYCVFQLGIGESLFQMGDHEGARASYQQLLQKCQNIRLGIGASLRLAHLDWLKKAPTAEKSFLKAYEKNPDLVSKYYPGELYNIGEILYRRKEWVRSRHFFNEFLNANKDILECRPYAQKRLGDLSGHLNEKMERTVGEYLVTKDTYPNSDAGILAGIRALFLQIDKVPLPERERRLKLVDIELDKVRDENYRTIAYLEKGMVLLNLGVPGSLEYLSRLKENAKVSIDAMGLGKFVRDRIAQIIETRAKSVLAEKEEANEDLGSLLTGIESTYGTWLSKGAYALAAQKGYRALLGKQLEVAVTSDEPESVFEWIDEAREAAVVDLGSLSAPTRARLARAFISSIERAGDKSRLAKALLARSADLNVIMKDEATPVMMVVAVEAGDEAALKRFSRQASRRKVASLSTTLPREDRAYYNLKQLESLVRLGDFKRAEEELSKGKDFGASVEVANLIRKITSETKHHEAGFAKTIGLWNRIKPEDRKVVLEGLLEMVQNGKLWKKGAQLLKLAEQSGLEGKESAPYYFLSGRANFESRNCKDAVKDYDIALLRDPTHSDHLASRYRMGKCLVTMKQTEKARTIWQDLVERQDSFWSPLAKNEIKLMSK